MEAVPVADGQVVARRFLAELKAVLETPTLLLL